jgi:phosphate transport system protein
MGLEKLRNLILDMAVYSENTVSIAIGAYQKGKKLGDELYKSSEDLRILQDEASELAVELIALYQPVASDLRFIKSCMEISYDFSRFGRYAHAISEVLGIFGDLSMCDKKAIEDAGDQTKKMIRLSIKAFTERDQKIAAKLREMDEVVDKIYLDYVKEAAKNPEASVKCTLSGTLILRYLERIADHATYIGDSVIYIKKGKRTTRK